MQCVVVLCVPRSGSSMLAGILHKLGVNMGDDLLVADNWNQRGYFEDRQFLGFHRAAGFPHGDPHRIALKVPAEHPVLDAAMQGRYARIIRSKERRAGPAGWGVKDPRMLFLFDTFHEMVRGPVRLAVPRREPEESITSLRGMFKMQLEMAEDAYTHYARGLAEVLGRFTGDVIEVDYATALKDPGGTVQRIASWVGVPANLEAAAFIDPALRRCRG